MNAHPRFATTPFRRILTALLVCAAARSQPTVRDPLPPDLVEIAGLDSTIRLDIRYATRNNFMKQQLYPSARAFLQRPAAEALVRANARLKAQGFVLLVFDAYRPWSVTRMMWDQTPPDQRSFVADPAVGSKHNRGCAVDVSLVDLESGREVEMPSAYDEFSPRASPEYTGGSAGARRNRDLLRAAMSAEGFRVNPGEWWHFDYRGWERYEVLDFRFDEIR